MEHCIDRNKLTDKLDINFYDELKKVEDDDYWIFSEFVFSKDVSVREKVLRFMLEKNRSRDEVSSYSYTIGMRHKLGVYQFVEWELIDPVD